MCSVGQGTHKSKRDSKHAMLSEESNLQLYFPQTPFNPKTSSAGGGGEHTHSLKGELRSPKRGFSAAAQKRDWHPFAARRQVMCLVIELLSDLINALAVSLSRRCHPNVFQKNPPKKPRSLCMLARPRDGAHMEDDTVMHAYICTPTNPLKIRSFFSSSYSSSPSHPSSATVVFIQSRVWRVVQLPGDSLQDHRWKQTWLALLYFFFFFFRCLQKLHTLKTF